MNEPRITPLSEEEMGPEAAAIMAPIVEAGRPWNIFRTLVRHPDLARRWMVFANHVLFKSTLPPRERELAILRVGWLCGSEYEWSQHCVIGREAGLSDAEIERVKQGGSADGWTELESLVLGATDELHDDKMVSDATWAALAAHWSEQQLMDLVFAVGQYTLVSMALKTLGVPLDDFLEPW